MPKFQAVGIDLGTTYSVVARLDEKGKTQIVRNFHGDILTPSVVLFDDQEIVVGKEAKKAAATESDRVAECVKRDMGNEFYSKPIRGENLPPEVIQACILRRLAADAERACGHDIKVVITVPAYFDEPRRKATADAGEMAGLDVLDIVNEPTAAALSYGEHLGFLDPKGAVKGEMKVLVYDLGGGTFDVTVIELSPGHFRTLATDGDVRLGGRDWDARLADYLADKFQAQHGSDPRQDVKSQTQLMRAVEDAKHTLTVRTSATVQVKHAGKTADLEVTREAFDEITEDLLERTAYTTRQVLQAAKTSFQYISHILLVGGSTRMPMVSRMLEKLSGGMKAEHIVNPDEAVARGAAIYAGYLLATREFPDEPSPNAKFQVTNVNSHSLGIEGVDQQTLRKENIILIPRNTPLPCRIDEKFVTRSAGQQSIVLQVLEGESKSPEQCNRIARAVMRELPEGLPKGYPVEVSYAYAANGRLSVRAKIPGTMKDLRLELEREGSMNDVRVARWKRIVSTDKGFDAFNAALEDVLQIEGAKDPADAKKESGAGQSGKPAAADGGAQAPVFGATATAVKPDTQRKPMTLAEAEAAKKAAAVGGPPKLPAGGAMLAANAAANALNKSVEDEFFADRPQGTGTVPMHRIGRSAAHGLINLVGHVVASVVGLSLGYYILCWIKPEANFLELNLPGLPPAVTSTPQLPGSPTKP